MKKILFFIITFFSFSICSFALDINSKYAILYNLNDDNVIYEVNSNNEIQIASLTKIMTTIVAIENIEDLNEYVTLTYPDFKNLDGYVTAGFKIGDRVTYLDLLYGIILPSGADAAQAVAIHTTGSIDNFVELMNDKVKELGLKNTHFSNPIGKDSNENYSSVYDVAKILKYALSNDTFKKIFTTRSYTTTNNLKLTSTITSKAKVLNTDTSFILGSKTGTTSKAGLCLASISNLNKVDYLLVTCGAPNKNGYPYNLEDAINIYTYYDENYGYKELISENQLLVSLKVKKSTIKKLDIYSEDAISVYVKNDVNLEKLEYKYNGVNVIDYTYKVGNKLGVIDVIYNDEVLYRYDIVLDEEIKKFPYYVVYISIGVLIFLFIIFIRKKCKKYKKHKKYKIKR